MKNLLEPAVDWTGQTWAGRIDQCASMLYLHGYIPLSVRDKIGKKLLRECEVASVDTLPKGQDGEAGLVGTKGSAVPPTAGDAQ